MSDAIVAAEKQDQAKKVAASVATAAARAKAEAQAQVYAAAAATAAAAAAAAEAAWAAAANQSTTARSPTYEGPPGSIPSTPQAPAWSAKTLRARANQARHPTRYPTQHLFASTCATGVGMGDGRDGVIGGGSSGGRILMYGGQRPATAGARLPYGGKTGARDRPRSSSGVRVRSMPSSSMTQRGQPSRPPPTPPQIMSQWVPVAGWRPRGENHGVGSTRATSGSGFKPFGATSGSGQPRFSRPASAQPFVPPHKSPRSSSPGLWTRSASASARRQPEPALSAPCSGRPLRGEPRQRLSPTDASPPPQHSLVGGPPVVVPRPMSGGGLVGHRGQSVGGGWYYPVVPAGATRTAPAVAPPTVPRQLDDTVPPRVEPCAPSEAHHEPKVAAGPAAGAGAGQAALTKEAVIDVAAEPRSVTEMVAREHAAPGVHSWSITSPWDEAQSVYQHRRTADVSPMKLRAPERTRLVGAACLQLPPEMVEG
jgi:hypothetical protein